VFEVVERIDVLFTASICAATSIPGWTWRNKCGSASRISPCSTPPVRRSPTACER
jgi:hypothetical protein